MRWRFVLRKAGKRAWKKVWKGAVRKLNAYGSSNPSNLLRGQRRTLDLFDNPVGFGQALGKTGQKPGFSAKSKKA
jgi:hypothetical protein